MTKHIPLAKLPVMPLKEAVMFPNGVMPASVGREVTMQAVWNSIKKYDRLIFAVTQRENTEDVTLLREVYDVGTVCKIASICECPYRDDKGVQVIFQGLYRAAFIPDGSKSIRHRSRNVSAISPVYAFPESKVIPESYNSELHESRVDLFLTQWKLLKIKYYKRMGEVHNIYSTFKNNDLLHNTGLLADTVIQHLDTDILKKQDILETSDEIERFQKVYTAISANIGKSQKVD